VLFIYLLLVEILGVVAMHHKLLVPPPQTASVHLFGSLISDGGGGRGVAAARLPLTISFLLEYSSEYLNEYSSTR